MAAEATAPSQLMIHRDGSLMYYVYIRKYAPQKYIGFAIVINGYYLTDIRGLFTICEKELERMSETGVIIHFTPTGSLSTSLRAFHDEEEETKASAGRLCRAVNLLKDSRMLPAVDYSFDTTSRLIFKLTDNPADMVNSSYRLAYTVILKDKDYATQRLNSVSSLLSRMTDERNHLIKENEDLKEANRKIRRQKRQFKGIAVLMLAILLCGIGLMILYSNLHKTRSNLEDANFTINTMEAEMQHMTHELSSKRDSLRLARMDLSRERTARRNIGMELDRIMSYAPFAVRSCDIMADQIICDYYSATTSKINVSLEVIDLTTRQIQSKGYTLSLITGDASFILDLPRPLSSYKKYYVVLSYENKILLGKIV